MNHVLLVDDDYVVNLAICEYLREAGFPVETAYTGFGALAALRRRPPWALVTDIDLGPGADGFDVARFARASHPGLPVVYISGRGGPRRVSEGVADSEFITKPCKGEQIVEALRRAVQLAAA